MLDPILGPPLATSQSSSQGWYPALGQRHPTPPLAILDLIPGPPEESTAQHRFPASQGWFPVPRRRCSNPLKVILDLILGPPPESTSQCRFPASHGWSSILGQSCPNPLQAILGLILGPKAASASSRPLPPALMGLRWSVRPLHEPPQRGQSNAPESGLLRHKPEQRISCPRGPLAEVAGSSARRERRQRRPTARLPRHGANRRQRAVCSTRGT
mmetsp:Transcript_124198/g.359179  ORF Transcript_124198/g.359179 Transcript_124198/m.359179 type:complete len:214 (+) Transcript_124198:896-1537(+)